MSAMLTTLRVPTDEALLEIWNAYSRFEVSLIDRRKRETHRVPLSIPYLPRRRGDSVRNSSPSDVVISGWPAWSIERARVYADGEPVHDLVTDTPYLVIPGDTVQLLSVVLTGK